MAPTIERVTLDPPTVEPISGYDAFQDALGMLHTIMTGRSASDGERTEAATMLGDLLLRYLTPTDTSYWNALEIPVLRS